MLRDVKAEMEALRKRFQAAYKADQRKRKREVSAVHDGPMREQGYSDAGIPGRAVYLKPLPGGGFDYRIPDAYGDDERHGEEDSVGEWELDRIAEKVAIPGHFAFWLSVRYPNRWCMDRNRRPRKGFGGSSRFHGIPQTSQTSYNDSGIVSVSHFKRRSVERPLGIRYQYTVRIDLGAGILRGIISDFHSTKDH